MRGGVHNDCCSAILSRISHSPTVVWHQLLFRRVSPLHCRLGRMAAQQDVYDCSSVFNCNVKTAGARTQSILEDGEHNAPEQIDSAADLHIYAATPTLPPRPRTTVAITKQRKSLVQRLRTTRWQLLRRRWRLPSNPPPFEGLECFQSHQRSWDLLNAASNTSLDSQSTVSNYSEARHKMFGSDSFPLFNWRLVRNARPG